MSRDLVPRSPQAQVLLQALLPIDTFLEANPLFGPRGKFLLHFPIQAPRLKSFEGQIQPRGPNQLQGLNFNQQNPDPSLNDPYPS